MAKKSAKKKATKKAPKKATKKAAGKGKTNSAFMAPLHPSSALGAVIGSSPVPRTQAVKKLWAYIKKHNLQDKKNKRMINPDDKLAGILGSKAVNMFSMMGLLKKHLKKA